MKHTRDGNVNIIKRNLF